MSDALSQFLQMIRNHKKQIVFAFFSFMFFLVFLFPFEDLSDYITEQIAKNTQNQVFVAFKDLGISIFPLGLSFKEVSVDTPFVPTLKASTLNLAPSIASFLAFKPGFVANASGLFDGSAKLTYKTGKSEGDAPPRQLVDLELSKVSVGDLAKFAASPVPLQGKVDLNLNGEIDPTFRIQPTSEFAVQMVPLSIPASTVPTVLGPLNVPALSFGKINLQGRLVGGELIIEESQIGQAGDSVSGRIKGKFNVTMVRSGANVVPRFGAYQLKLDLNVNREAEKDLGIFLALYDKFRTLTGSGARYAFQLNGVNMQTPPNAVAYSSF